MRLLATLLAWLVTTAALAVAVPAGWLQRNVVDADGCAALVGRAAADPALQSAMAAELAARVSALIAKSGKEVEPATVHQVAAGYTAGPAFPVQFAQAGRLVHRWLFADGSGSWTIDVAPMLTDSGFSELLTSYRVQVPESVPLTLSPAHVRPGALRPLADWGTSVSIGAASLAAVFAVLTLVAARRRGKALAGIGVSALLVGAIGYAGIEVGRHRLADALGGTAGNIREISDVVTGVAADSMHHWLLGTLAAGGVVVVTGVLTAIVGGLGARR